MKNNMVHWDPIGELMGTNDIFENFFTRNLRPAKSLWGFVDENYPDPSVDLYDKKDQLVAKAEIPGLEKKDIKVTVDGQILTISGERKKAEEVSDKDYYRCERAYGGFSRTISLPAEVQKDKVKAVYENGILTVEMPKSKKASEKEITIE
ncbi:Hsp20/alpha crystallin family protein [Elusimicrobiota bacterium]